MHSLASHVVHETVSILVPRRAVLIRGSCCVHLHLRMFVVVCQQLRACSHVLTKSAHRNAPCGTRGPDLSAVTVAGKGGISRLGVNELNATGSPMFSLRALGAIVACQPSEPSHLAHGRSQVSSAELLCLGGQVSSGVDTGSGPVALAPSAGLDRPG